MTTETHCDECYKPMENGAARVHVSLVCAEYRSSWFAHTEPDETEWDFCCWECAKAFVEKKVE